MITIELNKITPVNPLLKKLIKFYWILKSKKETDIHGEFVKGSIIFVPQIFTGFRLLNR